MRGFIPEWERQTRATVTFKGAQCLDETDKALRVRLRQGIEVWMPKSQIDDDSEVYGVDPDEAYGKLIVTLWISEQKKITQYADG